MYIFILTRTSIRDIIIMSEGSVSMKEILKNKYIIGFMVFVISVTVYSGKVNNNTPKLDENINNYVYMNVE